MARLPTQSKSHTHLSTTNKSKTEMSMFLRYKADKLNKFERFNSTLGLCAVLRNMLLVFELFKEFRLFARSAGKPRGSYCCVKQQEAQQMGP